MALPIGLEFHTNDMRHTLKKRRTWKERLFTKPWKPFTVLKDVDGGPVIKDGECLVCGNKIVVNSRTFTELNNVLPKKKYPKAYDMWLS